MSYPSISPNLSHSNPPEPNHPTGYSAVAHVAGAAGRVARWRSGEHKASGFCRSMLGRVQDTGACADVRALRAPLAGACRCWDSAGRAVQWPSGASRGSRARTTDMVTEKGDGTVRTSAVTARSEQHRPCIPSKQQRRSATIHVGAAVPSAHWTAALGHLQWRRLRWTLG
jgi:hypothetical protein